MLKPLEQSVVDQFEARADSFCVDDIDGNVLVIFTQPDKSILAKFKKDIQDKSKKIAYDNIMCNCILAPELTEIKQELAEDYQLWMVLLSEFVNKITSKYKTFHLDTLEDGIFCIKTGDGEILASFKKPGKHENKKYQRLLENGSERANLDLMLDCVFPKEDRARVTKMVDENILLETAMTAQFIKKTMEHINIRTE